MTFRELEAKFEELSVRCGVYNPLQWCFTRVCGTFYPSPALPIAHGVQSSPKRY